MRQTIIDDIGNPRLKNEVLDLISKLQDGSLLLNDGHAIDEKEIANSKSKKAPIQNDANALEDSPELYSLMLEKAKDQLIKESKRHIDDIEIKMAMSINKEKNKLEIQFENLKGKICKQVDELAIYQNALKDEQDRISERLQLNTAEISNFQKLLQINLKRMKLDVIVCGEDISALSEIVKNLVDNAFHIFT